MNDNVEVIPFHTREAHNRVDYLIEDTKEEMQEIQELKQFVKQAANLNDMPRTEEFLEKWREISKPDEEYDFFQERLEQVQEDHNLPDKVYADIYDEFTMLPQYKESAEAVINALQQNGQVTPPLAGQLNQFLNYSQAARKSQIQDFKVEKHQLSQYTEELDEIVNSFEDMNQYQLPLEVDRANSFWQQLESFEERVSRIRSERKEDYERDYNSVNLHGFLEDIYGEDFGVRQPVRADLNAAESRTKEAQNNIVI